jgi:hypothetical protein
MFALRFSVLRTSVSCAAAVAAILGLSPAHADPLAVGAIEQIDVRTSSVVVLGQRYQLGPKTTVVSESSGQANAPLAVNSIVWIDGQLNSNGTTVVDSVTVLSEQNVPGATQLLVSGVVSSVRSDGHVRIGQLNVDATATFASASTHYSVGDTVQVFGTQPSPHGVFVAQSAVRLPAASRGTGTQGVGGTGIQGVGGTGIQGVGGTGIQGVGGTGIQGVGGTGIQGVGGTGIQGVGGTGIQGVGGTGIQGVGGTGIQGVGGTGIT